MFKLKLSLKLILALTCTFLTITLLSQWFLVYSIKNQSPILSNNITSSILKCNCLLEKQLELGDLHKMKLAYLNELKKLENKRRHQLKLINELNQQIINLKLKQNQLNIQHTNFNLKLINTLVKLNNLQSKKQHELDQIKSINLIQYHNITNLPQSNTNNIKHCSSDQYFNYEKCDSEFKIFIPNSTFKLDFNQQTTNISDACLVIITNDENINNDQLNLVYIHSDDDSLELKNTRSIHASFVYRSDQIYTNMFIHFSLIQNKTYLKQIESFQLLNKYYLKRKYILSLLNPIESSPSLDLITQHLSNQKNVLIQSNLNIEQRLKKFSDSKFSLIIQSRSTDKWSIENTYQLIEALKCASLPVLIESNLKLPLDNLIDWDSIVIRLPLSRLGHLLPILMELNSNEIINRQIKATNIYISYFSSESNMFKTLLAAIQFSLNLQLVSVKPIKTNEITQFNFKSDNQLNSINLAKIEEESDEIEEEYLGEPNQQVLPSLQYINNNTLNKYAMWNKYFYPFGQFPSTPFDLIINYPNYDDYNISNETNFIKETNYSLGGYDGRYFHHRLGTNYAEEQFTIVMLTYNRESSLISLIQKYLKLPFLHSILIVWNSLNREPSIEFESRFKVYLSSKRIRILKMNLNSLNNRFLPFDLIQTDAVLSLDDDTSLRLDEIIFAFRVWRTNRDQIVGFPARFHSWNFSLMNYVYDSSLACEYSMVLTGAAFYHRFYNYYYSYVMNEKIRVKIDELKNCEDIAFNMMVAHLTRKPPIKVTTKFRFACPECATDGTTTNNKNNSEEQISLKKDHYANRSYCVQYFSLLYNYNPLMYSQYRADSVLYKTRLNDDNQKCFKYI